MSGTATIALNIQTNGAVTAIQSLNKVGEAAHGLSMGSLMGGVAGGELLAKGFEKAVEFMKDFAKESLEMAVQMGEAIEKSQMGGRAFQEFAFAAKFTGGSMETVTMACKKMSENIVNGSADLQRYGVDMNALKHQLPEDQFRTLMMRMEEIKDPAEKADFALKSFGKSGMDLIPMSAHFKELTGEAEELGVVMNDGAMKCARDMVEDFKKLWMQMQVTFVNSLPTIREWGDKAMAVIKFLWNGAVNFFTNIITDIILIPQNMKIAFDWIMENWDKLWEHLPMVVIDTAIFIGKTLLDNMKSTIDLIAAAFTKLWEGMKTGDFAKLADAATSLVLFPQDAMVAQMDNFKKNSHQLFEDLAKDAGTTIPEFLKGVNLFDGQEDIEKQLEAAWDAAEKKHAEYDKFGYNKDRAPGESSRDGLEVSKLAGAAVQGSEAAYKAIAQWNNQGNNVENLQLVEQRKMNDKLDAIKEEVSYNTNNGDALSSYAFT